MGYRSPTLFDNLAVRSGRSPGAPVAPRGLERFHLAHAYQNTYRRALREIWAGRKETHWMWFIFPQMITTIHASDRSRYYAIADRAEAAAYMNDQALRMRLGECVVGLLRREKNIFNHLDQPKLHRSLTLFAQVATDPTLLNTALTRFYGGPDLDTLELLQAQKEDTVGKYWEKRIKSAQAAVASVGQRPEPTGPMTRRQVESFVKGFVVSPAAQRRMVDAWMADQGRARSEGYDEGQEVGWESRADAEYYNG